MQAICLRLNISQSQYNELMFETGEEYFKWRCNGYEKALQAFRTSREMWHWWRVQYIIIDGQLLSDKQPFNMPMYRAFHIGLEYFPHEAIVRKAMDDYENIAQEIINKHKEVEHVSLSESTEV